MNKREMDKHVRLVECLAELLVLQEYCKELENYCDGVEDMCPVDHKQRRPVRPRRQHVFTDQE